MTDITKILEREFVREGAVIPEIVIEERDEARAKVWQLHQELNALQTHFDIVTKAGAGKDAEIERLRGENECLAAAMSSDGADACGALVVANAEIERLQLDLDLRTKEAHRHVLAIQHKDGLLLNQEEEIERLRELLRAAGVPEWVINARLSHE